jgi:hypothetical protein
MCVVPHSGARIEDHDDLVPVFNAQSEVLTSIYGEFFLAELIESQSKHNVALVAEAPANAFASSASSSSSSAAATSAMNLTGTGAGAGAGGGSGAGAGAGPGSVGRSVQAVGLMAVTDECDIRLLQDCFQLAPYDGLKKKSVKELETVQTKTQAVVTTLAATPALINEKLAATFAVFKQKEDERVDASDDDDVRHNPFACALPPLTLSCVVPCRAVLW